ncbi:MAG: hypothetical protein C5B49_09800, partial [Bdellovibrio sp.]
MKVRSAVESKLRQYLEEASQFQLGLLPTESRHFRTAHLSQLASEDLQSAIALLKDIDVTAVRAINPHLAAIEDLCREIGKTLKSGHRIYLCGCGATGRLSVGLETLWRQESIRLGKETFFDSVRGFIAGGDYALVRSIENFEDHPEYGEQMLRDLGFGGEDLLIATTEGGETPFVIGATEFASRASQKPPYFLFCNPMDILSQTVERSRRVIENPSIRKISLPTGPMALTGSTRMQATTVLMLAVGSALFSALNESGDPQILIADFIRVLEDVDFSGLAPLIEFENEIYARNEHCVHCTSNYGITLLADTTERTPTFSLRPFESSMESGAIPSWTYLIVPEAFDSKEAWVRVLGREPRALGTRGGGGANGA